MSATIHLKVAIMDRLREKAMARAKKPKAKRKPKKKAN